MAEIRKVAGTYFLQYLKDEASHQVAASKLGISSATVSTYKRTGMVPVSVELASKFLLSQKSRGEGPTLPRIKETLGIVQFPPDKKSFFDAMTKETGIKVTYLTL